MWLISDCKRQNRTNCVGWDYYINEHLLYLSYNLYKSILSVVKASKMLNVLYVKKENNRKIKKEYKNKFILLQSTFETYIEISYIISI